MFYCSNRPQSQCQKGQKTVGMPTSTKKTTVKAMAHFSSEEKPQHPPKKLITTSLLLKRLTATKWGLTFLLSRRQSCSFLVGCGGWAGCTAQRKRAGAAGATVACMMSTCSNAACSFFFSRSVRSQSLGPCCLPCGTPVRKCSYCIDFTKMYFCQTSRRP